MRQLKIRQKYHFNEKKNNFFLMCGVLDRDIRNILMLRNPDKSTQLIGSSSSNGSNRGSRLLVTRGFFYFLFYLLFIYSILLF